MDFRQVLALRGPNIWTPKSALDVVVDLSAWPEPLESSAFELGRRLLERMSPIIGVVEPALRGDVMDRLSRLDSPPHALAYLALEWQRMAGSPVSFSRVRATSQPEVYRVVFEYAAEALGRACLKAARELLWAAATGQPFAASAQLRQLRELADRVCLGPSTTAIVRAAEARGIPARRLNENSIVLLGQGALQRRIMTAETDRTGAIAESISCDKELTKSLLRSVGVPVPDGRRASDPSDAWEAAREIGLPVVVKPVDGNHGSGVFTELNTREEVEAAFVHAATEGRGDGVIVETFAPGAEHRLLVVGNRVVAASRGDAASVVGDGRRTVAELVEDQINSDPRRGEDDKCPLGKIELNPVRLMMLAQQGHRPDSVPAAGEVVLIQRNGNWARDVTDEVHPEVAARAVEAAHVVGLEVAGVDIVCDNIGRPLEAQRGAVVEVNAGPGLHMHLAPSIGQPRPVGEAIVNWLFPEGQTGRLPTVAVTGCTQRNAVARLAAFLLCGGPWRVGLASCDGLYDSLRRIQSFDASGFDGAWSVLVNPLFGAAVIEVADSSILREGLGFSQADVAVVTDLDAAAPPPRPDLEDPTAPIAAVRTVLETLSPLGAAVLNADHPQIAGLARCCSAQVVYFAAESDHPLIVQHRRAGGRAVFVRRGELVLAAGSDEIPLVPLRAMAQSDWEGRPLSLSHALAASAAAWALGVPPERIRERLEAPHESSGGMLNGAADSGLSHNGRHANPVAARQP